MTTQLDSILDDIREGTKAVFGDNLVSLILYGSYARGDYNGDSDIDIMAVVNLPAGEMAQYNAEIDRIASRLSLKNENCITICITLQDAITLDRYKDALPYFTNVLSEGVVLYAS